MIQSHGTSLRSENRLELITHSFQILQCPLLQLISALFFSHYSLDFPAVRGNKSTICLSRRYVSTKTRPIGHMVSQSPRDVHVSLCVTLSVWLCDTVCGRGQIV